VPVLITSCQVSEYPNNGPVITHTTTTAQAAAKANGVPRRQEACRATSEKLQDCGCSGMTFISDPNNFYLRPRFRSQTAVGPQQSFVDRESGRRALRGRDNSQLNNRGRRRQQRRRRGRWPRRPLRKRHFSRRRCSQGLREMSSADLPGADG